MAYQGQFTGDVQLPITSAILKTNSVGKILAAVAGVDYLTSGDLSGYLPLSGGIMTGQIVLKESSSSTDYTKGLRFPDNPFGGGGDNTGLRLYASSGENQVLELYVGNDGGSDTINFATGVGGTANNDAVKINGNKIWNAGNLPTPQSAITLTTTGTSGVATLVSNTLNIPDYGSALSGYLPLTGGTLTGPLGGTSASFSSSVTATSLYTSNTDGYLGAINSTNANGGYFVWQTSGTTIADLGTAQQIFGSGGNDTFGINGRGSRSLVFGTNNTERMRITSGGNTILGYSGSDSGEKLQVNGTGRFSSSVTANSTSGVSGSFVSNTFFGSIDLENTGGTATGKWNLQAVSGTEVGGSAGSSFGIYSYGASAYRIFINSSGNIGIGSINPASKLDVNGTGMFSSSVTATSFIKTSGTSSQFLKADGSVDSTSYGTGTVTSVAALTLGTTGTDVSSTVATGTTTPVITLNIPDASATARGLMTTSTQTFAGVKTFEGSSLNIGTIYNYSTLNILASSTPALTITDGYNGKFTFIPYENTTNGHLIRSTNYADSAYYPLTLAASRVQTPNGSLVVGGTNDNGYAFYTNGAGKFTGDLTANTLKTAAPTGSTAQTWKLGDVSSGTCVPANFGDFSAWFTGNVITIEINGSTYTIPVVVSNYC
jgi:hypothetical protein